LAHAPYSAVATAVPAPIRRLLPVRWFLREIAPAIRPRSRIAPWCAVCSGRSRRPPR